MKIYTLGWKVFLFTLLPLANCKSWWAQPSDTFRVQKFRGLRKAVERIPKVPPRKGRSSVSSPLRSNAGSSCFSDFGLGVYTVYVRYFSDLHKFLWFSLAIDAALHVGFEVLRIADPSLQAQLVDGMAKSLKYLASTRSVANARIARWCERHVSWLLYRDVRSWGAAASLSEEVFWRLLPSVLWYMIQTLRSIRCLQKSNTPMRPSILSPQHSHDNGMAMRRQKQTVAARSTVDIWLWRVSSFLVAMYRATHQWKHPALTASSPVRWYAIVAQSLTTTSSRSAHSTSAAAVSAPTSTLAAAIGAAHENQQQYPQFAATVDALRAGLRSWWIVSPCLLRAVPSQRRRPLWTREWWIVAGAQATWTTLYERIPVVHFVWRVLVRLVWELCQILCRMGGCLWITKHKHKKHNKTAVVSNATTTEHTNYYR